MFCCSPTVFGFSQAGYLSRKNSIIVFSDGEINSGTVASQSLVHEVRQNIRQMVPNLDDSQNQWVSISIITTGTCNVILIVKL